MSKSAKEYWEKEPKINRIANDVPNRVDRIKAIGNGQVPACAVAAFMLLWERLNGKSYDSDLHLNTLHLFAGAGGGIIADMMMNHNPVGAVEIDDYCCKVLEQRQKDGWLPKFPIFKDVKDFNGSELQERVDCVCGGFPCQDISSAGKGGVLMVAGRDYSTNSPEYVATLDRNTSSWRIRRSSLLEDSIPFSGKLPRWGMMRNGVVYQRPKLERGIKEKDGGVSAKITFPTTNVSGMRGGAHADRTLLEMTQKGLITEEERVAMGGRANFPNVDPSTLSFSYGSQKALKKVLKK